MISELIQDLNTTLKKVYSQMEDALKRAATFSAHPQMVESILVDHYGVPTPIKEIANIDRLNRRTLKITPWDKKSVSAIERGIYAHNKKINKHLLQPTNQGTYLLIELPALNEERRKEVVRDLKEIFEQHKKKVLKHRRDANEQLTKTWKDRLSEDEQKRGKGAVQKSVDEINKELKQLLDKKSIEVMKI